MTQDTNTTPIRPTNTQTATPIRPTNTQTASHNPSPSPNVTPSHTNTTPSTPAQTDHYAEMRMLQARWNQLSIKSSGSTPENSPSPKPKKRVYKPRVRAEKTPEDIYEKVDLSKVSRSFCHTAHRLCRILMGRANPHSPLPPPPDQFYHHSLQQAMPLESDPDAPNAPRLPLVDVRGINNDEGYLDQDYINYIVGAMQTRGILYFTMDWGAHVDDQFNQTMIQFFLKVWKWGLTGVRFTVAATEEATRLNLTDMHLTAIYVKHFKYLRVMYKKLIKDKDVLVTEQEKNSRSVALQRKTEKRQKHLMDMGVVPCYVDAFENRYCNSDDEVALDSTQRLVNYSKHPFWRSPIASKFIDFVEDHKVNSVVRIVGAKGRAPKGNAPRPRYRRDPPVIDYDAVAPSGLPEDWYNPAFLAKCTFADLLALKMAPRMFPLRGNFLSIVPDTNSVTLYNPEGTPFMPPHVSDIPLNESQGSKPPQEFPNDTKYDFQNHPVFTCEKSGEPLSCRLFKTCQAETIKKTVLK
ncbi:hypothetical protein DFH28DRAFT_1082762 [Melampsora americana]|nr:hypothetical protein DFH28DRAFT_1082762 [Melampsora americana]